jgi:hypothetical protein
MARLKEIAGREHERELHEMEEHAAAARAIEQAASVGTGAQPTELDVLRGRESKLKRDLEEHEKAAGGGKKREPRGKKHDDDK